MYDISYVIFDSGIFAINLFPPAALVQVQLALCGFFHIDFHLLSREKSGLLCSILCPLLLSIFCSPGNMFPVAFATLLAVFNLMAFARCGCCLNVSVALVRPNRTVTVRSMTLDETNMKQVYHSTV